MQRRRFVSLLVAVVGGSAGLGAQERQERLPIAPLVLTNRGFNPDKVWVRSGRAQLVVLNHSGYKEIDLRIERVIGPQKIQRENLKQERVALNTRKWRNVVDFTPGTFIVSVVGKEGWECEIIVEPGTKQQ